LLTCSAAGRAGLLGVGVFLSGTAAVGTFYLFFHLQASNKLLTVDVNKYINKLDTEHQLLAILFYTSRQNLSISCTRSSD
jgi:hypothetical protein